MILIKRIIYNTENKIIAKIENCEFHCEFNNQGRFKTKAVIPQIWIKFKLCNIPIGSFDVYEAIKPTR
jgi:hypothetical protein